MELIVALGIGVLAGCGVWLVLRPRTFQVVIGLSLFSYAVNLLIFIMGWVRGGRAPIVGVRAGRCRELHRSAAAGARPDRDRDQFRHDGATPRRAARRAWLNRHRSCGRPRARRMSLWTEHLVIAPVVVPLAAGALLLLYDERRRKLKAAIGACFARRAARRSRRAARPCHYHSGAGLCARRLARALRHRARCRPALGDDAAARGRAWNRCARLFRSRAGIAPVRASTRWSSSS